MALKSVSLRSKAVLLTPIISSSNCIFLYDVKTAKSWNSVNKETQKQTKTALRRARWGYMNSMLERALEEGDHKPLWKYCKSQRQDNIGVAPLKENG